MIDDRISCIAFNAFDGFGDSTGGDGFGVSVAWIDLDDHLEPEGLDDLEAYPYSDDVSVYVKSHPDVNGARWVLVFWDADGNRWVEGFPGREEMMVAYRGCESDYIDWLTEVEG